MDKHLVAHLLEEIGILLELQGENPFKVRAYHNAARAIENLSEDLELIIEEERLKEVPGIGESIAEKIITLIQTGHLPYHEKLKKSIPEGLLNLLNVPGLGGKKIKALYDELGIKSIDDLVQACQKDQVAHLSHFGLKTQENILNAITKLKKGSLRHLWWDAMRMAQPILNGLGKIKGVKKVELGGSVRRKLETIGDLDFLVAASNPKPIMEWFTHQPLVDEILAHGNTKSSVRLKQGIQADIRIIPEEEFGFALIYFTGSKDHNIKIRLRANERGLTLNEYGLKPLDPKAKTIVPSFKKFPTEKEIYQALGLTYIPPELREDRGEIEAAEKDKLPKLVEEKDIKGVFHCHTTYSDGHNTLEEMVIAAQEMGWEYFGIADHSKSSYQANGMQEKTLFEQIEKIRAINHSKKYQIHVFAGLECDILTDGQLDFSNDVLKELDYVVASVHRSFKQDEQTITSRIIKAIENPYITIIGHVTGRLLLRREPYAVNLPKVIDACIANNKVMELNAQPARLDMDWRFWHQAAEKGLRCCINPDAHHTADLHFFRAGVNVARKGWLEKKDVLNTLTLKQIQKFLKPKGHR